MSAICARRRGRPGFIGSLNAEGKPQGCRFPQPNTSFRSLKAAQHRLKPLVNQVKTLTVSHGRRRGGPTGKARGEVPKKVRFAGARGQPEEPGALCGRREGDADAPLGSPHHPAATLRTIRFDQQIEFIGNAERAGHIERGAGFGHVAHHTADAAAAERNGRRLQHPMARCSSLLVHRLFNRCEPRLCRRCLAALSVGCMTRSIVKDPDRSFTSQRRKPGATWRGADRNRGGRRRGRAS
jgi:hypothetical protein